MTEVYKISDNIISSLGFDTDENFRNIVSGKSGISLTHRFPFPTEEQYISLVDQEKFAPVCSRFMEADNYTFLEQMIISSVHKAFENKKIDPGSPDTLFVISTVKGNIDLICEKGNRFASDRIQLWKSAEVITEHFRNHNKPVVISNACISGTLAVIYALRVLKSGRYKNIVITGGDVISQFVVSGFHCLKAVDQNPCKPFDKERKGLSLGEGAATIILSSENSCDSTISIESGSSTNDANHISGPSRTGEGLYNSIINTLGYFPPEKVSFINAHGTGTIYNDEMESIAFTRTGLQDIPVNSLKGYFGHTLGASGIIETVINCKALEENTLIKSLGYDSQGTTMPLNIIRDTDKKHLSSCLKTSSGFGGTNATILIKKSTDE